MCANVSAETEIARSELSDIDTVVVGPPRDSDLSQITIHRRDERRERETSTSVICRGWPSLDVACED